MIRFFFKLILCALLAIAAGFAYLALRSGDPVYTFYEWISPARFQQYDRLIRSVAAEHQLDPMLVKAVVWRESRFDPQKDRHGRRARFDAGERKGGRRMGARKQDRQLPRGGFVRSRRKNLEAGTWYLHRAMQRWAAQSDPIPFALAEYNAGASRAQRWAGGDEASPIPAKDFLQNIDFPGTRKYVDSIIARYEFYKRRGRM